MKFLVFGDLMGRRDVVERLFGLKLNKYDFLIYTGDTPDPSVFKAIRETRALEDYKHTDNLEKYLVSHPLPKKALKKAIKEVVDICSLLKTAKISIYGVLGNADLVIYENYVKWPFKLLHNRKVSVGDLKLVGYSGRPLYQFENSNENERAYKEDVAEKQLGDLLKNSDSKNTILVTHAPPFGILDKVKPQARKYAVATYGIKAKGGNIGSIGIAKAVEKYTPLLHIFGHIHEARGVVRNNTTFINTGSTGEYEDVCEVELVNHKVNIRFKKLPN